MKIDGSHHNQMMLDSFQSKKMEQAKLNTLEFDSLMKVQKPEEMEKTSKIHDMIDNISDVKKTLEDDLSIENLEKYKEALRSFLEYYTKNELQMNYYYVRDSRTFMEKKVGIIESINEKMNKMTENMLETNKGHLELLHKMGEVQGLIVNLFV